MAPTDLMRAQHELDQYEAEREQQGLRPMTQDEKITYLNVRAEMKRGIVAGDGCYYPRTGYPDGEKP